MSAFIIVGAKFRPPAKALLDTLPMGTKLIARREPQNPHDSNAIAVLVRTDEMPFTDSWKDALSENYGLDASELFGQNEWHLGYIGREHAARLAPGLDGMDEKEIEGELVCSATGVPSIALR